MKTDYRELVKHSLADMIQTDYLTTALCFVPKGMIDTFEENYLKIAEGWVLPDSLKRLDLDKDDKTSLYRVVIMRHALSDFIAAAKKDWKFQVIEFDGSVIKNLDFDKQEKGVLEENIKNKENHLMLNCQSGFSETFYMLLHIKLLRLYVESALKYDNDKVRSVIIMPKHGQETHVVTELIKHFSDVSGILNRRGRLVWNER